MLTSIEALKEKDIMNINGGRTGFNGACFVYIVKEQEILSEIAQKYSTSVKILCEINNITALEDVRTGDKIFVPVMKE